MREVVGDMWVYLGRKHFNLMVTTNGYVKRNGEGVMGRGNALEAAERFPRLPKILGSSLKARGNHVSRLTRHIMSFPVKHSWEQAADLDLIKRSVSELKERALQKPHHRFVLPRPGCGNGRLGWEKVKLLLKDLPDNVLVITKEGK